MIYWTMEIGEIISYSLTFIGGGGIAALVTLKSSKKKAEVEVKQDEIQAIHDTVKKVYEPIIDQQNERIKELEDEVKSLRKQLATERTEHQNDIDLMNKRILAITNALGIRAEGQLRDDKGRFTKADGAEA